MDSGWRECLAAFCAPVFCASFPGGGEKGGGLVERVWGGGTWDIDSDCETHKNKTVTWLHMDTGGEKKKAQQLVKRGQKVLTDSFLPVELPELSHSQHIRLTFSDRHSGTAMLFYSFTASPHLSFSVFSNLNTFFHVFVHPFFFFFPFIYPISLYMEECP